MPTFDSVAVQELDQSYQKINDTLYPVGYSAAPTVVREISATPIYVNRHIYAYMCLYMYIHIRQLIDGGAMVDFA